MSNDDKKSLHQAVMLRNLDDVANGLARREDVDALDREGRTPLFYAAQDGLLEIVRQLVQHGANVNARDKNEETPLHFAARNFQVAVAGELIGNGADVAAQDVNGNTPLSRAVYDSRGRGEMIELLISAGSDKTLKNKRGVSPEDLAGTIGNFDVGKFLR